MERTRCSKVVLFDLDGTLTDPAEGITKSVRHALNAFGIEVPDLKELNRFIGPPLADSFRDFYGMDPGQCREAIRVMREYFSERGIFENRPYDGIRELLERLRREGLRLMVATSKPTVFACRILEHFGLAEYFEFVGGAELSGERQAKCEVIRHVLERTGLEPSDRIVPAASAASAYSTVTATGTSWSGPEPNGWSRTSGSWSGRFGSVFFDLSKNIAPKFCRAGKKRYLCRRLGKCDESETAHSGCVAATGVQSVGLRFVGFFENSGVTVLRLPPFFIRIWRIRGF